MKEWFKEQLNIIDMEQKIMAHFMLVMNNLIIILYLNLNFFMIFLVEMSERRIAGPILCTLLWLLMCMTLLKYCTKFCSVYVCAYQYVTKRSERFL